MSKKQGFSDMKDKEETFDIYRCKACGYVVSASDRSNIGTIHAHCVKHASPWSLADIESLEIFVERIRVTEWEEFESGS